MRIMLAALAALAVVAGVGSSALADKTAAPIAVMGGSEKWTPGTGPLPPTIGVMVMYGDPTKAGSSYAIRLKMPAGTKLRPHWHGEDEQVTVISGTLAFGMGTTFDESKMMTLKAGSYGEIPAGVRHYAMAKTDTVLQINAVGPRSMTYVKPGAGYGK